MAPRGRRLSAVYRVESGWNTEKLREWKNYPIETAIYSDALRIFSL
jgi:hypothetical protein